jgi:hypothetical protein
MSSVKALNSDRERLAILQTAADTGAKDRAAGRNYIEQATIDGLLAFVAEFEAATEQVNQRKAAYHRAVMEAKQRTSELATQVRGLCSFVRWQVRCQKANSELLTYYQFPVSASIRYPTRRGEWIALAGQLLQGDAAAVEAGYPGADNRELLQTSYEAAVAAEDAVETATQELVAARQARKELRQEAYRLYRGLLSELRHTLRELDPVDRREIMRTYGVRFRSSGAGQPNSVDVATPESAPVESGSAPVTGTGFQTLEAAVLVNGNGVVAG